MNWNEIGTQVIVGLSGVLLSALGLVITYLINKYVKNNKLKTYLLEIKEVVSDVVQEVYQTYVEALKKDGMFDKEAQKKALEMAYEKVLTILPKELYNWLIDNQNDIEKFIKSLIESAIYSLKVSNKK